KKKKRYVAVLSCGNPNENHGATLSVQETNQFRHLQHISLKLKSANEEMLKKYLGNSLLRFKAETLQLHKELSECKQHLQIAQFDHSKAQDAIQQLKTTMEHSIFELKNGHTKEMNELRSEQSKKEEEIRREQQKKREEVEEGLKLEYKNLEEKYNALYEKYQLLLHLALCDEVKQKSEWNKNHTEMIKTLRNEIKNLETTKFEQDKHIQSLSLQITVLQQQVKDKDELFLNQESFVKAAQEQKHANDEQIDKMKKALEKSEKKVRECIKEIHKGNNIITRLQNEIRNTKSENKVMEQQLIVATNDLKTESAKTQSLKQELCNKQSHIDELRKEIELLKNMLQSCKDKLEQSHKAIESNQKVISYLNKQINDKQHFAPTTAFPLSQTKTFSNFNFANTCSSLSSSPSPSIPATTYSDPLVSWKSQFPIVPPKLTTTEPIRPLFAAGSAFRGTTETNYTPTPSFPIPSSYAQTCLTTTSPNPNLIKNLGGKYSFLVFLSKFPDPISSENIGKNLKDIERINNGAETGDINNPHINGSKNINSEELNKQPSSYFPYRSCVFIFYFIYYLEGFLLVRYLIDEAKKVSFLKNGIHQRSLCCNLSSAKYYFQKRKKKVEKEPQKKNFIFLE
ncbi:hypothetical protein RFI_17550, partial [Reticulomyxa filosa]